MPYNRRTILKTFALGLAGVSLPALIARSSAEESFEITRSEAEWKSLLSPQQYAVLRDHGTERPFSSPLETEKRKGVFACAGCDLPLYDSSTKYDSGTGWPSFFDHLPDAIGTSTDWALIYSRTEVHCRRCGGHLGHVFDDGPAPTGKRYCMNGIAMKFKPADGSGA